MDMRNNIGRVKKKDPGVGENITHSFDEGKWKKLMALLPFAHLSST